MIGLLSEAHALRRYFDASERQRRELLEKFKANVTAIGHKADVRFLAFRNQRTMRLISDKRDCQLRRPRIGKPIERIVSGSSH